ncbi:MAG: ribosome biogenesis GTPase Der [Simkaniaceae bacterium]|nr:ribosome biogenesis GTPase Der [Simkaniaceae bacterium]
MDDPLTCARNARVTIALVGRPNVGKSALFNRIIGRRISIVHDVEGVTRDRIRATGELFGKTFHIVDTGGIAPPSDRFLADVVREQAETAIREADGLIVVVDGTTGITGADEEVVRIIRRAGKPVCLAVNKIDSEDREILLVPFYRLGIRDLFPVSAMHGRKVVELTEHMLSICSPSPSPAPRDSAPEGTVALIGRANVGKSTLLNTLLREERSIVSDVPGTTRDKVDVAVTYGEHLFTFVDTAGLRRKTSTREVPDKFAAIRTEIAIDEAEICIVMADAEQGLSHQDKRIFKMIEKRGKGAVLFFNKWDKVRGVRMEHCRKSLAIEAGFLRHVPVLFGSAKTGHNTEKIFPLLREISQNRNKRITTGRLNRFLESAVARRSPPAVGGKRLRIYYMAQISVAPPRFLLFVNDPERMHDTYGKYLMNRFREEYRFTGTPLCFSLRAK